MHLHILNWLWRTSWQASLLAGVVLLAQWLFRRHLTPQWRHGLWLLVVARLVLPTSFESRVSLFNLCRPTPQPVAASAPAGSRAMELQEPLAPISLEAQVATERLVTEQKPAAAGSTLSVLPAKTWRWNWSWALMLAWLGGATFLAWRTLRSARSFARRVRHAQPVKDQAILALLADCRAVMRTRRPVTLLTTEAVSVPALYGLWRPRLLLPAQLLRSLDPGQLRFVFLHELAHVKRWDIPLNWLATLVQIVHWFNPLAWLAFRRMQADRELACDALVLQRTGAHQARAYGLTILQLLEAVAAPARAPGLVGILEDKRLLERRIRMIAAFQPMRRYRLFSLALATVLGAVCLTDARPVHRLDSPKNKGAVSGQPMRTESSASTEDPAQALRHILSAWEQTETELRGYQIHAQETNVYFNQYDPRWGSSSYTFHLAAALGPDKFAELKTNLPPVTTRTCTHVYQFGAETVCTTTLFTDAANPDQEVKTLVTSNAVLELHSAFPPRSTFFDLSAVTAASSSRTPHQTGGFGIIGPRQGRLACGWPFFLSKSALAGWIKTFPQVSCSRSPCPGGESGYALDLSGGFSLVPMKWKLLVRASDFTPVELRNSFSDGTERLTELQFESAKGPGSLCQYSRTQTSYGGHVYQETTFAFARAKEPATPLTANPDSFFAPGTQVADLRFSKPISYQVGDHLPSVAEVQQMLARSDTNKVQPKARQLHAPPTPAWVDSKSATVSEWDRIKITSAGEIFVNHKPMTLTQFAAECQRLKSVGGAALLYTGEGEHALSPPQGEAFLKVVEVAVPMMCVSKENELDRPLPKLLHTGGIGTPLSRTPGTFLSSSNTSGPEFRLQGRTVSAWLDEAEIANFPGPALQTLTDAGPPLIPQLTPFLLQNQAPDQQAKAAFVVSGIAYHHPGCAEGQAAVPLLTYTARSTNVEVRIYSAQALAAVGKGASNALPVLIRLSKDEDPGVRLSAVDALGRVGATSPESVAALKEALSDSNDGVRLTAKQALGIVPRGGR